MIVDRLNNFILGINTCIMDFFQKSSFMFLVVLIANMQCKEKKTNSEPPDAATIKDSVLVQGLRHPWEILWGPDNFIWMTERGGRISRVNPNTGAVIPLITIEEVESRGEGGLLGMALHPNFSANPHVFVAY